MNRVDVLARAAARVASALYDGYVTEPVPLDGSKVVWVAREALVAVGTEVSRRSLGLYAAQHTQLLRGAPAAGCEEADTRKAARRLVYCPRSLAKCLAASMGLATAALYLGVDLGEAEAHALLVTEKPSDYVYTTTYAPSWVGASIGGEAIATGLEAAGWDINTLVQAYARDRKRVGAVRSVRLPRDVYEEAVALAERFGVRLRVVLSGALFLGLEKVKRKRRGNGCSNNVSWAAARVYAASRKPGVAELCEKCRDGVLGVLGAALRDC